MPEARPRVLAIVPSFYPSTVVGVIKPLQRLHQQGRIDLDITVQYLARRRAIERSDVVVMCGEALPPVRRILGWIAELGKLFVYELDDNRFQVPDDLPGLQYARTGAQQQLILDCIRMADVVRVYSPHLRQLLADFGSKVMLVAGPLDWRLVDSQPAPARSTIKLVYATSRQEDRMGLILIKPLLDILDRHPDTELTIWGATLEGLRDHPRVRHRQFVRNYDRFFRQFSREHFDIGLAPLRDDDFHRGKSNNKFREYASCGIAGVYSDMPVYNTTVIPGETGLLVGDDAAAWSDAITRLIVDAPLRQAIGGRARAFAKQHYNDTVTGDAWMAAFAASRAIPAGSISAVEPISTPATGGGLAAKFADSLISHGPAATWRRIRDYSSSLSQILSWRLRRSSHAH